MALRNPSELKALAQGKRLLGLDQSRRRIGVAVCDGGHSLATALETIEVTKFTQAARRIAALVEEWQPGGLVIGLPLNMDGSEGPRCQSVRDFARNLLELRDVFPAEPDIALWDERLSTARAADQLEEAGSRRADMKDALAAAALLQDFLDRA